MENKDEIKKKVAHKLNLAEDLKNQMQLEINSVKKTDGKIMASFCIKGIKRKGGDNYAMSYDEYKKIFNNMDEFTEYANKFFNLTEEEVNNIYNKERS